MHGKQLDVLTASTQLQIICQTTTHTNKLQQLHAALSQQQLTKVATMCKDKALHAYTPAP
jgi:adenylate cyclase